MDADDVVINDSMEVVYEDDYHIKKCPTDGFIQFSEVVELEDQKIYRSVLLDESKKEIAVGFFHRSEIKPFDAVYVKIMDEKKGGYLVYYNATSQSYGFMQGGAVWIPKDLLSVMTNRTIRGIVDGRMVTLKCKCGEELVMAAGLPRTLAACPKCKRADHVV